MEKTKFSSICRAISNLFLVLSIIAPFVIAIRFGRIEYLDFDYGEVIVEYSMDWFLACIYFLSTFIGSFAIYVIFGSIAEHLEMVNYITKSIVVEKKVEEKKNTLDLLRNTEKLFKDSSVE